MSTSNVSLGSTGAAHTVEHGGRVYSFSKLTLKGMNAFSMWLVKKARRALCEMCSDDLATLEAKLGALEKDVLDGEYEFFEPRVVGTPVSLPQTRVVNGVSIAGKRVVMQGGAVNSRMGRIALVSILCGASEDEAMALMLGKTQEVTHVLSLVMADSLGGGSEEEWTADGPEGNVPAPQVAG